MRRGNCRVRDCVPLLMLWYAIAYPTILIGAAPLEKFTDVRLVENPSNDADSFVVRAGDRQLHLRLYFADSPECIANTDAEAKRVREQAQYFGITDAKKVLEYGTKAKTFAAQALAKPFTVYTAFANAMGNSPGGRVYAFVLTADGKDLASLLVENGWARTFGTRRAGPDGTNADEIERRLQDRESEAMLKRAGIWAASYPDVIVKLRAQLHEEQQELKEVRQMSSGKLPPAAPIDLNTATTRELQSISGVGPTLAARIIAGRPYKFVDDLLRVPGIGTKLFAKIRPNVVVKGDVEPAPR